MTTPTDTTALLRLTALPTLPPLDGDKLDQFESWIPEATALLALNVADEETCMVAVSAKRTADARIKEINAAFEEPANLANKIHKALTGERSRLRGPWETVVDRMNARVTEYHRKREAEARALEARLNREAEERAQQEQARLDAERMPWEDETTTTLVPAPVASIPRPAPPTGTARKTEKIITTDMETFVLATAKAILERGDRSGLQFLLFDNKIVRAMCQRHGTTISQFYPGITYAEESARRIR
jgi:hypothetical protein